MKRIVIVILSSLAVLLIAAAVFFFGFAMPIVEDSMNKVRVKPPYQVSDSARELHSRLFVADLHADSLLWGRNLLEKSNTGQVDVPRLVEGNVALQAFTVVTKTPRGLNIEHNDDKTDNVFWIALAQRQPWRNLSSLTERAIFQAATFRRMANSSWGQLKLVQTKTDLRELAEARRNRPVVGGWLGIEGAHALDGNLDNIDRLFDAGFRMMAPTHFFDTDLGGSAHGVEKYGLTDKGREMVRRMEQKNMIVDLAHASEKTINDVLAIATRPVVVSHTGVRGTCDNQRNLSDDQLRAIAANGGLIGIGFWDTATCGTDAKSIARAVGYTIGIVGAEHVALGSDFDGAVTVPFDASGEALITEALLTQGLDEDQIAKVMGGNIRRFLEANLPD